MILGQDNINFLGMKISNGSCTPKQHIGEFILNFPEENLTRTQIEHFLGIVNHVRDFIPKVSQLINPLTKMLRKKAPSWGQPQTQSVRKLKELLQNLPTLHISDTSKRILQTDASDKY